jgi:hypothetical protein
MSSKAEAGFPLLLRRPIAFGPYIVLSTIVAAMAQQYIAYSPIAFALGYLVIMLNLVLLLARKELLIHESHAWYMVALLVIGVVAGAFSGVPSTAVISQVLGIAVMSIYFMSVLVSSRLSLNRWMDLYSTFAFFLAMIGLALFVVKHLLGNGERLASLYSEPSIYISCTLPAVGYYANQYLSRRMFGIELAVLVLSYGLADSAAGFLGLLLVAIFAVKDRIAFWQILLAPFVLAVACISLYFASGNVQLRVNDTVRAIMTLDLAKTNGSTYAMLSNLYGAYRAFMDYPVFGVGIGGYQYVYERYVGAVLRTDTVTFGLNMYDANSLYFRVPAELGIFGLVSLFGFLIICARVRGERHLLLRNAILPYLLERFYHSGQYFTTELYFFGGIYLLNYLDYRSRRKDGTLRPVLPVRGTRVPDAGDDHAGSHT